MTTYAHPEKTTLHPRLYFGQEDVDALKKKRSADPLAAAAWGRVLEVAKAGMSLPLPRWQPRWEYDKGESGQISLGGVLGQASRLAGHLAFAFLLTGDEKYARRATELMLSVCDMDYWTSVAFFQPPYDPPWRGTLETAGIAQWMGMAYDWLYNVLSVEDRERIRLAISYKGIMPLIQDWADPATRLPTACHIKPWGNWWVNCIAPAGVAALAIYSEENTVRWETCWPLERPDTQEEPMSARWVRLVKEAMDWFWVFEGGYVPKLEKALFWDPEGTYYPANFDEEGAYAEGANYLDAVMFHSFRFAEPYLRILGEEILPLALMRKTADFILYSCYTESGRMRAINFDDARANFATSPEVTSFLARKLRHQGMQWYLHASQGNFEDDSMFKPGESPVFTFLWYDPELNPERPGLAAPVKVYPGCGWGIMRAGWGPEDTFFAIKSGNTAGHAHADAGTFLLQHGGKPLVMDSGTSSYIVPEWHTYYHTTRAHSTIMVGGRGQVKRLPGRIVGYGGVPGCALMVADAAAPYEGKLRRFIRNVACLGGRYYVIVDELAKDGPGPFEWLLHYDGALTREDGDFLIANGDRRLLVRMAEPESIVSSLEHGFRATHEDFAKQLNPEETQAALKRADYLKVCPTEDRERQVFFAVLYPFTEGETAPEISVLRERGWIGVQVHRDGGTDLVAWRGPGARRSGMSGVETDAKLVALWMDPQGTVQGCAIERGTFLRVNGETVPVRAAQGTVALGV
ncbi:MAG: heparinase II/III family protein [Candidatus Latescibacterota bacterium]